VVANILLIVIAVVAVGVVMAFVAGMGRPTTPTIALVDIEEAASGGVFLEHMGGAPISNAFKVSGGQMEWLNIEVRIEGVMAGVAEAYFNGTRIDQMESGVYNLAAGDILHIKNFTVPLEQDDLITVVSVSGAHELMGKRYSGLPLAGVSYNFTYVVNEVKHEGGTTGISGAQGDDGTYENIFESSYGSSQQFNPSGYTLLGGTTLTGGGLQNLRSNDGSYMTFRSYQSGQTLYAHQETTAIVGSDYYLKKLEGADAAGANLVASMTVAGRQLVGKFVYPLTGVSSIPASTWTVYYRTWRDADPGIALDNVGSGNNGSGSGAISWAHTTGPGSNRIMIVGVSIGSRAIQVSSITYGSQSLTRIRRNQGPTGSAITSELWYLIAPASGTATVAVTLTGSVQAAGGSVTYTGVRQTAPTGSGANGFSSTPSWSVSVSTANSWLVGHLAIQGATATVQAEGSGQTIRWDQVTTGNRGHGSDKGPVGTGSQTMSWTLSQSANWAVTVAVLRPVSPVAHADVDILIRQSDDAVRQTIATDVANSANLNSTPTTRSRTYAWAAYTVVDQTDYLEIDYYIHVTTLAEGMNAYLRIDDGSLALANQTRITNIMLPSRYTAEVEFTGTSNPDVWDNLTWTVDSRWTTDSVNVTLQLYNYNLGRYANLGEDGCISYTSGPANIDQTQTQIITINPTYFRDASDNWKVKVSGVKTTSTRFNFRGDWIEFRPSITAYRENVQHSITGTPAADNYELQIKYYLAGDSEPVGVWLYNSTSGWASVGSLTSTSPVVFTFDLTGTDYISGGDVYVQYRQSDNDSTQTSLMVDYCRVRTRMNQ
jgi:hypothetical protein